MKKNFDSGLEDSLEDRRRLQRIRRCQNCCLWRPYLQSRVRWIWGVCKVDGLGAKWTAGEYCEAFKEKSDPKLFLLAEKRQSQIAVARPLRFKKHRMETARILGRDPDGYPIVAVIRDGNLLRFRCPWCLRPHCHGVGITDGFGMADGHRFAHCYPDQPQTERGYILREVKDPSLAGSLPRRGSRN